MSIENYIGWHVIVKGTIPEGVPIKVTEQDPSMLLWGGIRHDNNRTVRFVPDEDISERFSEETHPERFL